MAIDYRDFGVDGQPAPGRGDSTTSYDWWNQSQDDAVAAITATLAVLERAQSARATQLQIAARLYGNQPMMGLSGLSQTKLQNQQSAYKERLTFNLVQSATDAITAKIAKNKPKPFYLTSGGDYKMQRKAKKLNQFCDGIFYENSAYDLGVQAFRDGCRDGDGVVHVFSQNGRVRYERVHAGELWVDEIEAFYGKPRSMHRVKTVDRGVLMAAFGRKQAIKDAQRAKPTTEVNQSTSDLVAVRESWHLPSGPDARDGRHMITIADAVLLDEEWSRDHFPFARFRWSPRAYGFWSQGLAEQLQSTQMELNKLMYVVQRSLHLGGTFKIFAEHSSKVAIEHLTNDLGLVIKYHGTPPQYVLPGVVQPEVFQQIETLIRRGYELAGVSQLSAAAKKPEGLNSGKALREFNDIESDRFQVIGREYERFFLDLARLSVETAKEIDAEVRGGFSVSVPGKKFLSTIKWDDIDLEDDQFTLQAYPVSSLPQEPAGRMQTVQEWVQAGWITPRQGRRLMDFPDLEMAEGLANAAEEYLCSILDRIVDDGEITVPEPLDDLKLAREMALEYYQRGKLQELEPERLELLRTFLSQIQAIEEQAAPPTPPMGAAPGMGAPQAPPMPQQGSDLVQNAPGVQ